MKYLVFSSKLGDKRLVCFVFHLDPALLLVLFPLFLSETRKCKFSIFQFCTFHPFIDHTTVTFFEKINFS